MWTRYDVRWDFITDLCASLPGDSALVKAWLDARKPARRPPDAKSIDEIAAEVIATLPDDEPAPQRLVFARVNGGLAMGAHTIRAQTHLKGDLRLKFLKLVCGLKGPAFEPHQATLTAELGKFLTPKALTE